MPLSTLKPQRFSQEKVNTTKGNPKLGVKKLAELYVRRQISSILKEKQSILGSMGQTWLLKVFNQVKG